jgi:hypothetical protein
MKRDLKWHGYEPNLDVKSLDAFFAVIERDQQGRFFGWRGVKISTQTVAKTVYNLLNKHRNLRQSVL